MSELASNLNLGYMFVEAFTTAKGRLACAKQVLGFCIYLRPLVYNYYCMEKSRPCKKNWPHVNSPLSYMPPIHVKIIIIVITISSTFQILIYDIGKCHYFPLAL